LLKITFALTSTAAILSAGVFPTGVFTTFVASQQSSAAISLLPAAMSLFLLSEKVL